VRKIANLPKKNAKIAIYVIDNEKREILMKF